MRREQIQERFKKLAEAARRGAADKRRAAIAALKRMVERYPWLRDYARLLGAVEPGLTREFPWLAPAKASPKPVAAKTRHTEPPGCAFNGAAVSRHGRKSSQSCATEQAAPWFKPPTEAGYEYRQCYKTNCKCMNGGAWHGPYHYGKKRYGDRVNSEYLGREVSRVSE